MALPHVRLGVTKHEYKTKDGKIYKNGVALTERQIVKELQEIEEWAKHCAEKHNEMLVLAQYLESKLKENKVVF
jgi:DNA polymerase III delta prime subunit